MNSKEKTGNKIPEEFKKYFWDCEFTTISYDSYPSFVAERILNYGDQNSIRWLLERINPGELKKLIQTNRNLNNKTRNYWNLLLLTGD